MTTTKMNSLFYHNEVKQIYTSKESWKYMLNNGKENTDFGKL